MKPQKNKGKRPELSMEEEKKMKGGCHSKNIMYEFLEIRKKLSLVGSRKKKGNEPRGGKGKRVTKGVQNSP